MSIESKIARPTREAPQLALFDVPPDWRADWWGMPAFDLGDARPYRTIAVSFLTPEDLERFMQATGLRVTPRTDGLWYPQRRGGATGYYYDGPKVSTRYPVYIISKGRHDCATTPSRLDEMGVEYRICAEETEADAYAKAFGEHRVLSMPFHDLGQGSIPARNWVWEHAAQRGTARYWLMDDNIKEFARCHANRRLNVRSGAMFRAMEDFADRFENVAIAGPHGKGFVNDADPALSPFAFNRRVYSCSLIKTDLPHRWRGRYNEDTDLCLRFLKDGHATLLFRSFLMQKAVTAGAKGAPMKGGNTDNVYNTGDHRRAFAESLREQHPDVVSVVWKFNRWHHEVDYTPFAKVDPKPRAGVVPRADCDEYGLVLRETA